MNPRALLATYAGLLGLLGFNVLVAYLAPGWSPLVLLGAAAQALLVMIGFMELGRSSPLIRFFALGAWAWVLLLFGLTLADLLTRA